MCDLSLTARGLNRALLARQGLLDRLRASLPAAVDAVGCIQAQYAPSMYVGLWSRLDGLQRDDVTRALEQRTLIQATLMRTTIHLCSREDYWPLALATRDARRAGWLRTRPDGEPTENDLVRGAEKLRPMLAGGETITRKDLEAALGKEVARGVGAWVDLVRVPPSGTWTRRRADLFGLAEDWLGPPPRGLTVETAQEQLVRRYLTGFGPASRADIQSFTGLSLTTLDPILRRLDLRAFNGGELLDLPDGPLPDSDPHAPVRFLPTWDATLLVHARRTGLLPEEYRPRIFSTKNPHSVCTFLVDGAVAGSWRYDAKARRIDLEPFAKLDARTRRELTTEAERLTAFHA